MRDVWLHLHQVSTVGAIPWLFGGLLAVDLILTLLHTTQEYRGKLWRYFGAIAGVWVPDLAGVSLFFIGLTLSLWALAWMGIAGWLPFLGAIPAGTAMLAVGALIGGRISDAWFSHMRLDRSGFRPNPGLSSARYYLAEAVVLSILFGRGLTAFAGYAAAGVAAGSLFFFSVLPFLRLLRRIPSLRRVPWVVDLP
jgi:hypothetical protein